MFAYLDDIYILTTLASGGGVTICSKMPDSSTHPSARWKDPSVEQRWRVDWHAGRVETLRAQSRCNMLLGIGLPNNSAVRQKWHLTMHPQSQRDTFWSRAGSCGTHHQAATVVHSLTVCSP